MENRQELRIYKAAPLPFQGQKRNFIEHFKKALTEFRSVSQIDTVVDLFGGSGLLSHTAKRMYPELRVIYNDFDDFHVRLENVNITNNLIKAIREYLTGFPKEKKIEPSMKCLILSLIRAEEKKGHTIDYITLSSSLMFSGKYATCYKELEQQTFYNNVKKTDYAVEDYLQGIEVVKSDYLQLFNLFKDYQKVLFVLDPPYLSTDTTTYGSNKYWKLRDYLNVLNVLIANNYIYFTSNKSSLIELCEWFSENYSLKNPFSGAKVQTYKASVNYSAKYTDMMLYKYQC
ncbi:DNA methyltransferase [Parabacteroides provencensis]|uniref:DNA methyltransferase n=1 Tax=Parabacteroides provencensis TaxID=1944636 RepID=UPI000C15BFAF|nr:DNA methyltransferase [Parabacteroides provencensis]